MNNKRFEFVNDLSGTMDMMYNIYLNLNTTYEDNSKFADLALFPVSYSLR